jgi:hypothetical protein
MAKDRTDLIHRALRNLGVLPQGQSPSAEESQSVDDLIDPMVENLRYRFIAEVDPDNIEDHVFLPLANILAAVAAPEFGQDQNQATWALKERAELDLKEIWNYQRREHRKTMKTDYYLAAAAHGHTQAGVMDNGRF